jgi:site-specific DNA recombinase
MQPMQAAIYARVSSEQQADAHTIARPVTALRERVTTDGLVLPAAMQFLDEGYSGATLLRPALERLRDMAAAGGIDRRYVPMRPIGWRANMPIRSYWSKNWGAVAWRSSS